ncbi:hypothetical protein ZWY2020_017942 [Hordeum vulgare]|nr:hypothetical protein ZWY2020_017942 [Hordeum vulgare]
MNGSMKTTYLNMEIEALANHIHLTRGGEGEGWNAGNGKKTKKKIFRVPQEELDDILSFQVPPAWPSLAKRCPSLVGELEKIKDRFLAEREKMRRQYRIMGYATFEAELILPILEFVMPLLLNLNFNNLDSLQHLLAASG